MKRPRLDCAPRATGWECVSRWSTVLGARVSIGLMALLVALLVAPRPALAAATVTIFDGRTGVFVFWSGQPLTWTT